MADLKSPKMSSSTLDPFVLVRGGVVILVLLTLADGVDAKAQQESPPAIRTVALDSITRRVRSVSPRSGPPGTEVTLRSGGLPAITPLRIGIGATHFGFEEIGQVMTDRRGGFAITVEVPSWTLRDVTYRFIVFDFYFRPIALSNAFHVTGADGTVVRRGTIVEEGSECPALRGDDHVLYSLVGDVQEFETGDRVIIEGAIVETSVCMRGTILQIVGVRTSGRNW